MASNKCEYTSETRGNKIKDLFEEKLKVIVANSNDRSNYFTGERYDEILHEVHEAKLKKVYQLSLSSKQYRRLRRYDILTTDGSEKLIEKHNDLKERDNIRYYCKTEDLFNIIENVHVATGHKKSRVMEAELKKKYCNVTRTAIQLYLSLCEQCQLKKKILAAAPILSNYMNSRCQVGLIDMQWEPDGEYNFILNYQDHLTKFTILKPLKTKTATEVAYCLIDVFSVFGAPFILQSDDGREFSNQIIQEVTNMWPGLKLVHGKSSCSQSEVSVKQSNQDVRDMLAAWIKDEGVKKWSEGLKFIQSKKNRLLHEEINKSPYEAMFGCKQRIGLADSSFEKDIYNCLETEEDLENIITGMVKHETDDEVENDTVNTFQCAACRENGVLQICGICSSKLHSHCGNEVEGQVICSHCIELTPSIVGGKKLKLE